MNDERRVGRISCQIAGKLKCQAKRAILSKPRSEQQPDFTSLLGHGTEFVFYSKDKWMPVKDFRQKRYNLNYDFK